MNGFFDHIQLDVNDVIRLVLVWLLAWAAWKIANLATARLVNAIAGRSEGETGTGHHRRSRAMGQLLRGTCHIAIVAVAVLSTLGIFRVNLAPVLTGAGILGLTFSFGAQGLVKDLIAGFFFLSENQFSEGDVIEAAGKAGVVERMTLRMVMLRDLDGTVHIIPNGQVTVLSNKTRGWSRAVVDIGISYDNDIDAVIRVLKEEADTFAKSADWAPRLDAAPDVTGVESFGESGITVRVLLRTKPGSQWDVAREFRRRAMIRLEREGIKGDRGRPTVEIHQALPTVPATQPPAAPPVAPPPDAVNPLPGAS